MIGSLTRHARALAALSAALCALLTGACRREHGGDHRGGHQPLPSGSIHLAMGVPRPPPGADGLLLVKPTYALSYSPRHNVASWVSWELNASYYGDAPRYAGHFFADDTLPAGVYRVHHEDYVNSGYDRGHMCRSEERTRSPEDNQTTFVLTNVLPQTHELNAGPWLRLEEYCRKLAQRDHKELFVTAGGIFGDHPATIGHGVAVPEAFFKIVVVLDPGQRAEDVGPGTRVIAVIMPNTTGIHDVPWDTYRTSVDVIERRTGYDFLTAVPEGIQRVIEARVDSGPTN